MRSNTPPPHYTGGQAGRLRSHSSREGILSLFIIFTFITPVFAAPAVQSYDQLLNAIREVRVETQKRIEKAVDAEKVKEAWETGKLIDEHILQHKERADYGQKVIKRLAEDLGTSERELRYMLEFFRTYPIVRPGAQLSWSKYQALLGINDEKERQRMTEKAVSENWDRDRVRKEVQRHHALESKEKYPAAAPGKINTYRVVKSTVGPYAGKLGVDLGFSNYFKPEGIDQFKEGDMVTLVGGKLVPVSASEPFTYTAYVTEVIDGDTFHALVDLGFNIATEQKLRLRGLDAPEIESSDGREAKEFLEKLGIRPGAKILIKTAKSDKYDRYLADVWTSDGAYVNQALFDEGLAVLASE